MAMANAISVSELNQLIGTPTCPAIIDICIEEDFCADPYLIPGSRRHRHDDVQGLIRALGDQAAVIVCQKGLKLSQGVAAWLRAEGLDARFLAGGMFDWRDAGGTARLPATEIPKRIDGKTLWVARTGPSLKELFCLWLIRRFVDIQARILFVEPDQIDLVSQKFGATPLPATDRPFVELQDKFHLRSQRLVIMSSRIPDTEMIWTGLSTLHIEDQNRLEAGLAIFDALYAYTGQDQAGSGE